jgi:hypothetical protein
VIYDLGRFFGYLVTMEEENASLKLSSAQARELLSLMEDIDGMTRIEADWAEETLEYLELDLLTPAQLMVVDQIAINRQSESSGGTGTGTGAGAGRAGTAEEGTSPLQSYINGGAFNPVNDDSKSIGQGFYELMDLIRGR